MKQLLVKLALCLVFFAFASQIQAQIYGFKGGPSMGVQNWNGADRQPLFRYHGAVFTETWNSDNSSAVFAQLGYHVRGSAIWFRRGFGFTPSGQQVIVPAFQVPYKFNNASLLLGMKKKRALGDSGNRAYYSFGLRGEYTISTNLQSIRDSTVTDPLFWSLYPIEEYVRRFNWGVTVGGGIEFKLSEFIAAFVELNISPDFSRQYYSPLIPNLYDPLTGQPYSQPEQTVRNASIELSFGMRFLRVVEYLD